MAGGSASRLANEYQRHLARELQRIIDERFDGHQTKAARAMGISQAHLSNLTSSHGRGPGIAVLVQIRQYTGRSIDALLGLPPLPDQELLERLRMSIELEAARAEKSRRERDEARASAAAAATGATPSDRPDSHSPAPKKRRGRPRKNAAAG